MPAVTERTVGWWANGTRLHSDADSGPCQRPAGVVLSRKPTGLLREPRGCNALPLEELHPGCSRNATLVGFPTRVVLRNTPPWGNGVTGSLVGLVGEVPFSPPRELACEGVFFILNDVSPE